MYPAQGLQPARHAALYARIPEAHERTLELIADLDDEQMIGPRLAIVNPLRWETGHVAWFYEYWLLRHLRGREPLLRSGDELYNSAEVAHDTRWDLPLPSKEETIQYVRRVLELVIEAGCESEPAAIDGYDEAYFLHLALFHECMHAEAFTYTRQTLGYAAPPIAGFKSQTPESLVANHKAPVSGDAFIPGGRFLLGSAPGSAEFFFDNELEPQFVTVRPFHISRTAVTQAEFCAFVEDNGYRHRQWWSEAGWQWRQSVRAVHPLYWQREANGRWLRRNFNEWVPLEDDLPVLHVNWYEAEAYCRWAGRRLPTEAEWEMAACCEPDGDGIAQIKRRFPWGDELPTPERANLDWRAGGCVNVHALPAGDSAFGVRQMIGNAWEWTATDFGPFPGFRPGPYKEYSAPWFGDHKVLRGGCWATRSHLIRPTYRNFYKPDRRDVWAGFRTCAQ
ncbi:MAG TPA: selenoneine synthase SenA [Blastocatellia bacterium]|nr:selenoneine synthase SenA [Blastocatellia bacterium]